MAAGARVVGAPVDREWGGYSGYVADPEGNRWEIAWLPGYRCRPSPAASAPSAVFRAQWSEDGNKLNGAWEWPGGGYKLTLTRTSA